MLQNSRPGVRSRVRRAPCSDAIEWQGIHPAVSKLCQPARLVRVRSGMAFYPRDNCGMRSVYRSRCGRRMRTSDGMGLAHADGNRKMMMTMGRGGRRRR